MILRLIVWICLTLTLEAITTNRRVEWNQIHSEDVSLESREIPDIISEENELFSTAERNVSTLIRLSRATPQECKVNKTQVTKLTMEIQNKFGSEINCTLRRDPTCDSIVKHIDCTVADVNRLIALSLKSKSRTENVNNIVELKNKFNTVNRAYEPLITDLQKSIPANMNLHQAYTKLCVTVTKIKDTEEPAIYEEVLEKLGKCQFQEAAKIFEELPCISISDVVEKYYQRYIKPRLAIRGGFLLKKFLDPFVCIVKFLGALNSSTDQFEGFFSLQRVLDERPFRQFLIKHDFAYVHALIVQTGMVTSKHWKILRPLIKAWRVSIQRAISQMAAKLLEVKSSVEFQARFDCLQLNFSEYINLFWCQIIRQAFACPIGENYFATFNKRLNVIITNLKVFKEQTISKAFKGLVCAMRDKEYHIYDVHGFKISYAIKNLLEKYGEEPSEGEEAKYVEYRKDLLSAKKCLPKCVQDLTWNGGRCSISPAGMGRYIINAELRKNVRYLQLSAKPFHKLGKEKFWKFTLKNEKGLFLFAPIQYAKEYAYAKRCNTKVFTHHTNVMPSIDKRLWLIRPVFDEGICGVMESQAADAKLVVSYHNNVTMLQTKQDAYFNIVCDPDIILA